MTEHTKTPWRVRQSDFQPFDLVITTTGKKPVFVATGIKNDMDAYHIVKAVNSHEKLVEALSYALEKIEADCSGASPSTIAAICDARIILRNALAAAEVKS